MLQECKTADDVRALARKVLGVPKTPVVRLAPPPPRPMTYSVSFLVTNYATQWFPTSNPVETSFLPRVMDIINTCAAFYRISPEDIRSPKRNAPIVRARHVAMHLARKLTGHSFLEIGELMGGKDHSCVVLGNRKILKLAPNDPGLAWELKEIERRILCRG